MSIFLLKNGTGERAALKPGLHATPVRDGRRRIGTLYSQQNPKKTPRWLALFDGALATPPDLFNASSGAVLLIERGKRRFALSFGHGRHMLKQGTFEENFGLRVTLNCVDPDRLRSIDRKTFDAHTSHSRTQVSQEGSVDAFGLNIEQDLLRAATGQPLDEGLGRRMTGMDALLVAVNTSLNGLGALLDGYLSKFEDDGYKKGFPWVDRIGEVRDATVRGELDAAVVDLLCTKDPSDMRVWLAVPDLIDWTAVRGFRYRANGDDDPHPDLHVREFLRTLRDRTRLTISALKQHQVFAIGAVDDSVIQQWSIYACLYAEVEHDGTTFLLSSGKWYRVEKDFAAGVDKDVAALVKARSLPKYAHTSEGAYNDAVAQGDPAVFALLDCKLVRVGGSSIEFCDLYTTQREMIHVKRYGGSSVLSHLFAQGAVSANTFLNDAGFRAAVNGTVPASHQIANPSDRPDPTEYEVVYAIVSSSAKPIDRSLPFFSRLNLRSAARQLQGFGFRVSLAKIATK